MNGDGRADVMLGAPFAGANGAVFRIDGAGIGDAAAATGDLNGDGKADILLGALVTSTAYLVYGRAATTPVALATLGTGGFRLVGSVGDHTGAAVAGVGDVNGDGRLDLAVGAPGADPGGRIDAGAAYVTFTQPPASSAASAPTAPATTQAQAEAEEVQEGLPPSVHGKCKKKPK